MSCLDEAALMQKSIQRRNNPELPLLLIPGSELQIVRWVHLCAVHSARQTSKPDARPPMPDLKYLHLEAAELSH